MDFIYPFFKWADQTWLHDFVSDSTWMFPAIEGVHIVALALLFGAVIVLNLRLLGIMQRQRPAADLGRELGPWIFCSLVIILTTGVMLFFSEATRSFHSGPFRLKMVLLVSAIFFHYVVSKRIVNREDSRPHPLLDKTAAVFAILLWVSIGFAGRAIGFF
jgi:hypothetical protein